MFLKLHRNFLTTHKLFLVHRYNYQYTSSLFRHQIKLETQQNHDLLVRYSQIGSIHTTSFRKNQSLDQQNKKNDEIKPPFPVLNKPPSEPPTTSSKKVIETANNQVSKSVVPSAVDEIKPSLWQRFKKEMLHYYHGFRLLGLDLRIATGLCFQVLRGHTLTRRERNQLVRTVADIFRLVPFAVFIIVPFMEFLLPVYIKLFPFMLPSTFKEQKTEEEKIKLRLVAKLEMAKFLQETISQTSTPTSKQPDNTPTLAEFSNFMTEIRQSGQMPQIKDIVKFSRLFEDQITLDSLDSKNLRALCQILDVNTIGPANLLRLKLYMRVRNLKAQDQLISTEGVDQIPPFELQSLCRERGMRSLGLSEGRLRKQLNQWLELHLNHKVPISLLLLSRAMYMHDATPAEQLQKVISSLPESVSDEAEIKISQTEAVDTKTKIELLRREQQSIKKERAELKQQEKVAKAEIIIDKAPEIKPDTKKPILDESVESKINESDKQFEPSATIVGPEMNTIRAEELLKHLVDSNTDKLHEVEEQIQAVLDANVLEKNKTVISIQDLGTISKAISELEASKKDLHEEEVDDIKTGLNEATKKQAETQEALIAAIGDTETMKQNKTARQLASRVDKMLSEMNNLLNDLSNEKSSLIKEIEYDAKHIEMLDEQIFKLRQVMAKHEGHPENRSKINETIEANRSRMIEVNELMLALRKIQKVPDDTKWQRILEVMDEDKDGRIELKHVLSVIELMGSGNMKLDSKEMKMILDMLDNEDLLEKTSSKTE